MNYEPFIERDLAAIPAAVAEFRAAHSPEETWTAVTRFAVLAFAPSQHSMHALLACLSVWDLREDLSFDDAITQCAIYAAASRQPWSEPPMLDPPKIGPDQRGDVDELREAIAASDRLRAERWLAKRYRDAAFTRDYGACLKAHAIAKRLRPRFANADFDGMLVAMHRNLEKSSEEMTFA